MEHAEADGVDNLDFAVRRPEHSTNAVHFNRLVAAFGDPDENDDELDYFGDDHGDGPQEPAQEKLTPQTDEPQVPIRKEKARRHQEIQPRKKWMRTT